MPQFQKINVNSAPAPEAAAMMPCAYSFPSREFPKFLAVVALSDGRLNLSSSEFMFAGPAEAGEVDMRPRTPDRRAPLLH